MKWLKDRLFERTSVDGIVLIASGLAFILLGPIAKLLAYAAVAYGIWTFIKKEA